MATETSDSFARALERFRGSLTKEQQEQFSGTDLDAVTKQIQNIQDELGAKKRLRNFNKISKFLEAMSQVEQLVQVFLNVHETVAFVWVCGSDPY